MISDIPGYVPFLSRNPYVSSFKRTLPCHMRLAPSVVALSILFIGEWHGHDPNPSKNKHRVDAKVGRISIIVHRNIIYTWLYGHIHLYTAISTKYDFFAIVMNDKYSYTFSHVYIYIQPTAWFQTTNISRHIYSDLLTWDTLLPTKTKRTARPQIGRVWEHLRERRGRFLHAEGKASNVKLLKECLKTGGRSQC